jgi:glycosyltransferase involved in cell wall biosynthesis
LKSDIFYCRNKREYLPINAYKGELFLRGYPLISIITPILNRIKYLEPCIKSVLNQDYPYIEHVFVDGGSTDGTVEMLSNYKAKYPDQIALVIEADSVPGSGCGEAWNKGLRMAKGNILGWLGSDDMLSGSDAIQTVVEFFTSNPDAYFVHGSCEYVNEKGERLRIHKAKNVTLDELVNYRNPIACPSAFYRRTVIETIGGVDDYGNDYDLMIRIAKSFTIHHLEDVLSKFRVHRESDTGNLASNIRIMKKDYLVSRRHGGRILSRFGKRYFVFTAIKRLGLLPVYSYLLQRKLRRKVQ